jgi:membrane-bound ClpP family serine protease
MEGVNTMIVLGVVLLLLGWLLPVSFAGLLVWLGVVALVIGLVLLLVGSTGHAVGGRRHYW